MQRLGAIFVVICMVLIAASAGAVLFLLVGLRAQESMIIAISILTGLAIYNAASNRLRDRANLSAQIADLSRGTGDLARQVAEVARRTAALETQGDKIADAAEAKARAGAEAITTELGELSTLVRQLAETVSVHELKFANLQAHPPRRDEPLHPVAPLPQAEAAPAAPAVNTSAAARANMIETIRNAIDGQRVDLFLQPVVTLPQRKVRYYESLTRLRTENGTVVMPADFIPPAEAGGLMARIDNMMLFRSVQVVRRLQIKNREIGLFCNVSPTTLNDTTVFPEILQFMDANRAIAPSIILEFRQSVLR
jgi:cyclic-di-GMP phosphodiesterase TipF (flagellum assembly factor)